jgi:hypothetical protein
MQTILPKKMHRPLVRLRDRLLASQSAPPCCRKLSRHVRSKKCPDSDLQCRKLYLRATPHAAKPTGTLSQSTVFRCSRAYPPFQSPLPATATAHLWQTCKKLAQKDVTLMSSGKSLKSPTCLLRRRTLLPIVSCGGGVGGSGATWDFRRRQRLPHRILGQEGIWTKNHE